MITIRRLQADDKPDWFRLRWALWPDDTPDEMETEATRILADPDHCPVWVATRPDGSLCGLLEAEIRTTAPGCVTDRIAYIEAWYIDPDVRRQGIGRQLIAAAEAWARAIGITEMASDTTPDYPLSPAAHQAAGFYEVERYFRKELN